MFDPNRTRSGSATTNRGNYTTPSICTREGHAQSRDISEIPSTPFCKECGANTISACTSCAEAIHGTVGRHPGPYDPPNYCHNCGSMYPWTALRIEAARALPVALLDAMHDMRLLGNDAGHLELKDFDRIGLDESTASVDIAKEILKGVYQYESLASRLTALKAKSPPP